MTKSQNDIPHGLCAFALIFLAYIFGCTHAYKLIPTSQASRKYGYVALGFKRSICQSQGRNSKQVWTLKGGDSDNISTDLKRNGGGKSQKHKYRDPTRPTDGRPGVRRSTNPKFAGKSKGNGSREEKDDSENAYKPATISFKSADNIKSETCSEVSVPRERHQQLQYQQRTQRLYDSLSSISSASQFLQKLGTRKDRASLDFDHGERVALSAALDKYLSSMSAAQLATLLSYLGAFTSSRTNWRSRGDGDSDSQVGLVKKQLLKVAPQLSAKDMAAAVSGLARMNLDWERTFPNNKNSFTSRLTSLLNMRPKNATEGVRHNSREENRGGIGGALLGDVIWGLGSMNARLDSLPRSTRIGLIDAFEREWDTLSTFSFSSALWALSKTGLQWGDLNVDTRKGLPLRLAKLSAAMSPQQSSKVLWALGTSGAKLGTNIPKETMLLLLSNVESLKRSKSGSAIGESQALIGVAKLGAQWSQLDKATKTLLLEIFLRVCKASGSGRGVSNSFWAMGTIGFNAGFSAESEHFPGVTPGIQPASSSLQQYSHEMDTSSTITLHSIRNIMTNAGERAAKDATAWAMCNVVWGLSKMKVDWNLLDADIQTTLMTNIARLQSDMNSVDICIMLWSLGAMNCPLDVVPSYFATALLSVLDKNLDQIEAEELSKAIWGLSSCSVNWAQLSPSVRWKLNVALRRVGSDMTPQGVANCAYGMAIMAFDWDRPSEAAFRGVHETLLSIIIRNKMDIFARRDGMDAYRRVKLEAKKRNRRTSSERFGSARPLAGQGKEEAEQITANSFDMDIELDNMPVYMQDIDTDKILRMTKEEEAQLTDQERQQQQEYEQVRIFAHYLNVMKFVSDIRRIPKELLAPMALEKDHGRGSRLQSRVLKGLHKGLSSLQIGGNDVQVEMETATTLEKSDNSRSGVSFNDLPIKAIFGSNPVRFGISLEASSFQGVFPVDAAVVQGKRDVVAIIEVNGPTHYRHDGRVKRKDQLKEAMYMKKHPDATFHRIRYNDANKLGSNYLGEEVANVVIGSLKDQSPLSKMMRRTKQNIGDFFSWGLRNDRVVDEPGPDGRG